MESNGEKGEVCVSQATRDWLDQAEDVKQELNYLDHSEVVVPSLNCKIMSYIVKKVGEASDDDDEDEIESESHEDDEDMFET